MARDASYKVPRRRRREGKTDYYRRYTLVSSGRYVAVVRFSNKYVSVQVVKPTILGDVVIAGAHSRELYKYFDWRGGGKSTPAAYLTGLLAAIRARYMSVSECALDIGLKRPVKGSKVFAVAKAFNDVGVKIPVDEEMIPSEDRINGSVIASYAGRLSSENPDRFKTLFSDYLKRDLDPRELPNHFREVLNKIISYGEKLGVKVSLNE
ncbi:MAG: 50S ribosomal protein L18 [Sulfolobales archaeon]